MLLKSGPRRKVSEMQTRETATGKVGNFTTLVGLSQVLTVNIATKLVNSRCAASRVRHKLHVQKSIIKILRIYTAISSGTVLKDSHFKTLIC